jgi:hypothetical protein
MVLDRNTQQDPRVGRIIAMLSLSISVVCLSRRDMFIAIESAIMDVRRIDEIAPVIRTAPRFRRIANFGDDNQAKCWTNFTKSELVFMNENFDLDEDVFTQAGKQNEDAHYYKFHREELLIFVLVKMKDGASNSQMADKILGGDSRRWSSGYKYIRGSTI